MGLGSLFALRLRVRPGVRPGARSIGASESGASAVEFALLIFPLIIGCMATVDLGMALYQKMSIHQSIRAGAEGLMVGGYNRKMGTEEAVKKLAETIAERSSGTTGDGTIDVNTNKLSVTVQELCYCPDNLSAKTLCTNTCGTNSVKPYKFYEIEGTQPHQLMYLQTSITLRGKILVQVE